MVSPLCLLIFLILSVTASAADPFQDNYYKCSGGSYTGNSTFNSNLNALFNFFTSLNSNTTFSTHAEGSSNPGSAAYGLILCSGDASPSDCQTCIQRATENITSLCKVSRQATLWYQNCELRYDDRRFFSVVNEPPQNYMVLASVNATDPDAFAKLEKELIGNVIHQAVYNSSLMYATGEATAAGEATHGVSDNIYALAQCTRDLTVDGCGRCLQLMRDLYKGNEGKLGGRVLGQSCNFRYEPYVFFQGNPTISLNMSTSSASVPLPASPPSHPPSTTPNIKGAKNNTNKVLLIVIPVAVGLVLILIVGICFVRRSAKNIHTTDLTEEISSAALLSFDLLTIKIATDNFNDSKKLGQGGFGTVYKGTLPNGEDIAVKRLSARSRQGIQELKNELVSVARLQHKNLVRLRGICLEQDEKLLVYEYMSNGSLDNFLFDSVRCKQLNWERRFKIIWGIARGLLYLHEECHLKVIHRDLKASNILLDADMEPKIADFGLARLFREDETHHITGRVVGTFGYMAPEYARRGHFSMKADVFSFGIIVLEIVTRKRSNGFKYDSEMSPDILSYTWEHWRKGTALEIIDPSMGEISSSDEVLKCIQIGLLCAQEVPVNRPPMLSVFLMLNGHSMDLQEPLQPKSSAGSSMVDSTASSRQSDLSCNEEFARTHYRTDEDRLIIRSNTSEARRVPRNLVVNRQTA